MEERRLMKDDLNKIHLAEVANHILLDCSLDHSSGYLNGRKSPLDYSIKSSKEATDYRSLRLF